LFGVFAVSKVEENVFYSTPVLLQFVFAVGKLDLGVSPTTLHIFILYLTCIAALALVHLDYLLCLVACPLQINKIIMLKNPKAAN